MLADKDFPKRLNEAALKMSGVIPEKYKGRNEFIGKMTGSTPEAVRKWFAGEASPRWSTMVVLAKVLDTDATWLFTGIGEPATAKEKKALSSKMEGVAHLAFGMAQMEGARCAPPDRGDPRKDFVDFVMIKGGVHAAIKTSLGREIRPEVYEFVVPSAFEQVHNVGFVWHNSAEVHMLDLKGDLITAHKSARGSDQAVVVVYIDGQYVTDLDEWPRINSIGEVL